MKTTTPNPETLTLVLSISQIRHLLAVAELDRKNDSHFCETVTEYPDGHTIVLRGLYNHNGIVAGLSVAALTLDWEAQESARDIERMNRKPSVQFEQI